MPREYRFMDDEELEERLVAHARNQERDHVEHTLNAERFEAMLRDAKVKGQWRLHIEKMLADTRLRIVEVETILDALDPQLPAPEKITAALERIQAKDEQMRAARLPPA